jgi:hypothetical protein
MRTINKRERGSTGVVSNKPTQYLYFMKLKGRGPFRRGDYPAAEHRVSTGGDAGVARKRLEDHGTRSKPAGGREDKIRVKTRNTRGGVDDCSRC